MKIHDASNIRKNYWNHTVKRAGIVYRKPYSTRHTFAVEMLNSGKVKSIDFDQFGLNLDTEAKEKVEEVPKNRL